jgi:hypothetical protein
MQGKNGRSRNLQAGLFRSLGMLEATSAAAPLSGRSGNRSLKRLMSESTSS